MKDQSYASEMGEPSDYAQDPNNPTIKQLLGVTNGRFLIEEPPLLRGALKGLLMDEPPLLRVGCSKRVANGRAPTVESVVCEKIVS